MATSSIFANVRITDPVKATAFIDALDAAANAPIEDIDDDTCFLVTDIDTIRAMWQRG